MVNQDQQLSPNFWLREFAVSKKFPQLADEIEFTDKEIERIKLFSNVFLESLRYYVSMVASIPAECAIVTTSGKRPPLLNTKEGGASNSDHLFSEELESLAVDITCTNLGRAWKFLLEHRYLFKMIYVDVGRNFIHISMLDKEDKRGVAFMKSGSNRIYL